MISASPSGEATSVRIAMCWGRLDRLCPMYPSGESIFGYLVHLVAVNSLMDSKIMFLWASWPFLVIRVGRNVLCDFLHPLCKWNSCYLNVYYAQDAGPFRVYWLCTVIHPVWWVSLKGGNLFGHLLGMWKSNVLDSSTVFGLMKPIPVHPLVFWGMPVPHLPGRGKGHIYLDILEQSDAVRGDQACCQNLWLHNGID